VLFTSQTFLVFFLAVLVVYWLGRGRAWQNLTLLAASYAFYGWVYPWHVLVLAGSTLADYALARQMSRVRAKKRAILALSLALNLSLLFLVKYYFQVNESIAGLLSDGGVSGDFLLAKVVLPLGVSFYVLKKIAYMIDVSRGTLQPADKLIEFAVFVSFFPQVLAGPIERAQQLLPQLQQARTWKAEYFHAAWPLLVMGLFKKLVIADSVRVIVDQIFQQEHPAQGLVLVGVLGFTLQILADFSGYTDLSRGFSFLLGLETSENFAAPYLSLTPGDFWNRWHMTFSFWLRDYVFFPLRRLLLRRKGLPAAAAVVVPPVITMLLSGLWHGTGWTFLLWGLHYGVLIAIYQLAGVRGDFRSARPAQRALAWFVMFSLIVFGWLLFRAPSLQWVAGVLFEGPFYRSMQEATAGAILMLMVAFYALPMVLRWRLDQWRQRPIVVQASYYALATVAAVVFFNSSSPDFIYLQF
jgi:D-alanyl-lipoteichoic acid acyltransferase DltB (MBOAT superfamily)